MTHPLTDKKLKELFWDHAVDTGVGYDWTSDGMRAAYDKGAADRLEQVFEWLYNNLYLVEEDGSIRYLDTHNSYGEPVAIDRHQIIDDLEAAMRPQQQEDNQ